METELQTTITIPKWQLQAMIDIGNPFYIEQHEWTALGENGFIISSTKRNGETLVATWKVTPKIKTN